MAVETPAITQSNNRDVKTGVSTHATDDVELYYFAVAGFLVAGFFAAGFRAAGVFTGALRAAEVSGPRPDWPGKILPGLKLLPGSALSSSPVMIFTPSAEISSASQGECSNPTP